MSVKILDKKIYHRCTFMIIALLLLVLSITTAFLLNQELLCMELGTNVAEITLVKAQGAALASSFSFICFFIAFQEFVIMKFLKVYVEAGGVSLRGNQKIDLCSRIAKVVYCIELGCFVFSVLVVVGFAAFGIKYSEAIPSLALLVKFTISTSGKILKCLLLAGMGISGGLMIGRLATSKRVRKNSSRGKD